MLAAMRWKSESALDRCHWNGSILRNSFCLTDGWTHRHVARLPHHRFNMLRSNGKLNCLASSVHKWLIQVRYLSGR